MTRLRDADVLVTGLGAMTPLGGTAPESWQGLLDGRSGVRTLQDEQGSWPEELPVSIAGSVAADPVDVLGRVHARKLDRGEQLAVAAAREAFQDAGSPRSNPSGWPWSSAPASAAS